MSYHTVTSADGTTLRSWSNEGDGVPVVICNGLGTPHDAWPAINGRTESYRVVTWDPERGREIGGSTRLELAGDDIQAEITRLERQGIQGGRVTKTRFGTEVYDLADPDGHLVRIGPAWTLHAIEGAV